MLTIAASSSASSFSVFEFAFFPRFPRVVVLLAEAAVIFSLSLVAAALFSALLDGLPLPPDPRLPLPVSDISLLCGDCMCVRSVWNCDGSMRFEWSVKVFVSSTRRERKNLHGGRVVKRLQRRLTVSEDG